VRFTYLLLIRCFRALVLYSKGLVVLRDHTNLICGVASTVYWRNEAHDGLARSSIVKMMGSDLGETVLETHLHMGKS
jgi:hypothetical protein